MKKDASKSKPLLRENYLAIIHGSVGSKLFKHFYCETGDRKTDILRNGDLSCAYFVSAILKLSGLIDELHMTVSGTLLGMRSHDWKQIKTPRTGAVIVWAAKKFKNGESHRHIGFYVDPGRAISNNSKKKSPQVHAADHRPIEAIFWNEKLSPKPLRRKKV